MFFVAKSNESGRILGCISYRQITTDTVEMQRLSVDKEFRRLKIAKKLVHVLFKTVKENGYDTIYLETSEPQIEARQFYEKIGFQYLHSLPIVLLGIRFDILCGFKDLSYIKRIQ